MKNKINFHKWLKNCILVIAFSTTVASCSDFLDADSHHALADTDSWQKLEDARAGVMGMYGLMRAALADNNTLWVTGELRNGDFTAYNRPDLQAVIENRLDRNIQLVNDISDWRRFYAVINAASVLIDHIGNVQENDQAYSEQTMKWDIAQARALRALSYYYLVRIWGDVPLITQSYDNADFPQKPRTPKEQVLAYAKSELIAAAKDLPFLFGTDNNRYYWQKSDVWNGALINKLSAYAILADLSAWTGEYADAETYASYVIDNFTKIGISSSQMLIPISTLTSSKGVFCGSTNSAYRLLAMTFKGGSSNWDTTQSGHLEQWTLCSPYVARMKPDLYVSKDSLFNIYADIRDERFGVDTTTMKYNDAFINMTMSVPIFKKVNVVQDGAAEDGNFGVFGSVMLLSRMEDMLLLRAEARSVMNRVDEALNDLNEMRQERGLPAYSYKKGLGASKKRLIDEIFKERRRELIGEGHRWFDIIRRQKLLKDNPSLQTLIDNGGIYWPVSEDIISKNPKITQNEYWK